MRLCYGNTSDLPWIEKLCHRAVLRWIFDVPRAEGSNALKGDTQPSDGDLASSSSKTNRSVDKGHRSSKDDGWFTNSMELADELDTRSLLGGATGTLTHLLATVQEHVG